MAWPHTSLITSFHPFCNAAGQSQKALEASAQRKEGSQAKPKSKQAAEQPGSNAAERKQKAKAKDYSTDRSMPSKGPKVKHQKAQQEPPESERRLPRELRATDGSMPGEGAKIKQQRQERQKAQQDNPESQKVSAKEAAARSTSLSKRPSGTQLLKPKAEQRAAEAEDGRLDSGQQDIEAAHLDAASVSQIKKATAQALAAPDAERHVTMSGEERIRAWQTQQESAQRDAAAPAQPTEGHAGSSSAAAGAGEASRQKGSDASSLERSPGMPLNEQQQQPRQSGNELAIAAAAEQHIKQGDGAWLSLSPGASHSSWAYSVIVWHVANGMPMTELLPESHLACNLTFSVQWLTLPPCLHMALMHAIICRGPRLGRCGEGRGCAVI